MYYCENEVQEKLYKKLLQVPNIASSLIGNLKNSARVDCIISSFLDGEFWQNHPKHLLHANESNTLVISVCDYYDDFEIANLLGSHAGAYKIGVKYTVVKGACIL